MKNKNFFIMLGTIIALTAIIVLLLRGCKDTPLVSTDTQVVNEIIANQRVKDSVYRITVTQLTASVKKTNKRADSLSAIISKKDKALDASKAEVAVLVAKSYLIKKDSIQQRLDNCDSIKREAIYLAENVTDYQRAQETLMENNRQLLATMQRSSEVKDSAYVDVKGQLDFLTIKFSKLDYNYQKINKKLTNSKTINKILGAIAIVTTGILIAK